MENRNHFFIILSLCYVIQSLNSESTCYQEFIALNEKIYGIVNNF